MRVGNIDGKGTIYEEAGQLVLRPNERVARLVPDDNIDVSEGTGILNMQSLFDSTAERGTLFVTNQRVVFLRKPDPILAARQNVYPVGMADAVADAYKARVLAKERAVVYCEIEHNEIEGFWVRKRTYGVLFLQSSSGATRKAIMHQRGPQDDKFVVLKSMLRDRLPETEPEDKKGSFLLGSRHPFLGTARKRPLH